MLSIVIGLAVFVLCNATPPLPPGALVDLQFNSTVGVLLDEIPNNLRQRAVDNIMARPDSFWIERALTQTDLTAYRLAFRSFFYQNRGPLPLIPKDQRVVTLTSQPRRVTIQKHDLVIVDYLMSGILLTDSASLSTAEPALDRNNGKWTEPFILPIDPEQLVQRTGYACMDEDQYPKGSIDPESPDSFYDHTCKREAPPSDSIPMCLGRCHCSPPYPTDSCKQTLFDKVGYIDTGIVFTRLAWNAAVANRIRALTPWTPVSGGADVIPVPIPHFKFLYRYFDESSCARKECLRGSGWRRLAMFDGQDLNIGEKPLDIGSVTLTGPTPTPLAFHNQYVWDPCHGHYHFEHFISYTFNPSTPLGYKQGFCIENVIRVANTEWSPVTNRYSDCSYQGISPGWSDIYNLGIPCQWIDITDVPGSGDFSAHLNSENLLCEGVARLDANGNVSWVTTDVLTRTGEPVEKVDCAETPGAYDNNIETTPLSVPANGDGAITLPCYHPDQQFGVSKDCEFTMRKSLQQCPVGYQVRLNCRLKSGTAPQVLRICESSLALATGTACTYLENLANGIVLSASTTTEFVFTCPVRRDARELGGFYSLYTSPLIPGDPTANVECTAV